MAECNHTIKSGKFAGGKCKNNAHHDGYCWKHKKNAVPKDIAEAVGTEKKQEHKPEQKQKYKFSAFRWTVNSNTSALKMNKEQVGEFKRLIGFIFDKDHVVEYLVDKNAENPRTNLDDVQTEYHFEIAPTTKAVHAHGVLKIKHHGFYRLDTETIREIIAGILGKKAHINIQAGGDADAAWQQYIEKNQAAEKL